jgi:hypothetical protein
MYIFIIYFYDDALNLLLDLYCEMWYCKVVHLPLVFS